ncbi:hypothetical protein DYB32_010810 [Aphanomyces invadans]|uniref:Peptidase S1 domain-containing protein n=1 Tax=Aphanomyces invadans TaxID=157072 RepID=A0A3R6V256_9STRA|nr:hypothetical protein DYB32_010810 [Aphanomyces invadans]
MTKFLALAALFAFAAARPEIFNGTIVPKGKYKYVATIHDEESGLLVGGATLIAPKVLLTAASCAEEWADLAWIGSHYLRDNTDGERIKVVKRIVHPDYDKDTSENDVAIFVLETKSNFTPVALNLNDAATEPGTVSWMRGFGMPGISISEDEPPVLMEAEVKIWSNDECRKATNSVIFKSNLCAYSADKDPCSYNEGGPLIIMRGGVEYVAGVLSLGKCNRFKEPSVYTRVSSVYDFIKPYLAIAQPEN